jgi:hypothetical protein
VAYQDPQLLYFDEFLTNISIEIQVPMDFASEKLFQPVNVGKQSSKYWKFNHDNAPRRTDDIRGPGAEANELPPMTVPSRDLYFAEEHSLEDVVPDEEEEQAEDPFRPMREATERLVGTIQLNRELLCRDMVNQPAAYAAGHSTTLSGTAQWDDPASDPIGNSKTARKAIDDAIFQDVNFVMIGNEVAWALEDHPAFLAKLSTSTTQMTNDQVILDLMRIGGIIRARGRYNAAPYGKPANMQPLWGNDVIFAHIAPRPARKTISFGYEFVWPYPGGLRQVTERWREEKRKSDIVRVSRRYDLKLVGVDDSDLIIAGYLFKDAV